MAKELEGELTGDEMFELGQRLSACTLQMLKSVEFDKDKYLDVMEEKMIEFHNEIVANRGKRLQCMVCNGSGEVYQMVDHDTNGDSVWADVKCLSCDGKGFFYEHGN